MGIVQDTLCGIRKFTLRDTFLDWNAVQNILLWVPEWDGTVPIPAIIKPKPLWTGKQILSLTIPRGINISRAPDPKSNHPVFDDGVLIENGELIYSIIEKKLLVLRRMVLFTLCSEGSMVVDYWLIHNGFGIDIGDIIADSAMMAYITQTQTIADRRATCRRSLTMRLTWYDDPRVVRELGRAPSVSGA